MGKETLAAVANLFKLLDDIYDFFVPDQLSNRSLLETSASITEEKSRLLGAEGDTILIVFLVN